MSEKSPEPFKGCKAENDLVTLQAYCNKQVRAYRWALVVIRQGAYPYKVMQPGIT